MRKVIGVLITVALLLSIAVPALARQEKVDIYENQTLVRSVAFIIGLNEYFVNDQVPGVKMDAAPFIQDGRTFVPVRFLGNALGVKNEGITWSQAEQKAGLTLGSNSLSMVIGKKQIVTNGRAKAIDVAPVLRSGRTFLPARYVAEGLGYQVDWDPVNRIVICWPEGEPKPALKEVVKKAVEFNGKPEAVKKLESALGITMTASKYNPGCWLYNEPNPYIPDEPARSEIIANKDKSYVNADFDADGTIRVNIRWASVVDTYDVTYDLSPIEKTLRAFFPGQEARFPAIMAKAKEIAEVCKKSNGFERAKAVDYYLDGRMVQLRSDDFNFVSLIF